MNSIKRQELEVCTYQCFLGKRVCISNNEKPILPGSARPHKTLPTAAISPGRISLPHPQSAAGVNSFSLFSVENILYGK